MTELSKITDETAATAAPLPPAIERFVLHWGDLGTQWGVNRSVAQIHALLYASAKPLTAEEISALLGLARSNVSNSIKELLSWDLIRRVPVKGDRREHFEAEVDVWEMVIRIAKGRKSRELDPAIAALRTSVAEAERDASIDPIVVARLRAMRDFTETADTWTQQMLTVPKSKLALAMKLGSKIIALIPGGKK